MTLPSVQGWIIDFRTARAIFESGNNQRISHCVEACSNGHLHCCYYEIDLFKKVPALKPVFADGTNCQLIPDGEIMKHALRVSNSVPAKKMLPGNDAAVFITAFAATHGFGVISDHRGFFFSTVYDLCIHYGIPVLSADDYFNEIE
jgi:hypothetical protein